MENTLQPELTQVLFVQTPPGKVFLPRQIPPGCEEIELILSGFGDFTIDGQAVRLGPGSGIWFYGEEWIHATADRDKPYGTMLFRFKMGNVAPTGKTFRFQWSDINACRDFSRQALAEFTRGSFPASSFSPCLYFRIIWEAENFRKKAAFESGPATLRQVLEYLDNHYTEPITLLDAATSAGVSVSHLHFLFRRHLEIAPFQYVLKKRLTHACRLLAEPRLTLKEICQQCGFGDLKNFCSYFKRNQQMTPGEYRALTGAGRERRP